MMRRGFELSVLYVMFSRTHKYKENYHLGRGETSATRISLRVNYFYVWTRRFCSTIVTSVRNKKNKPLLHFFFLTIPVTFSLKQED